MKDEELRRRFKRWEQMLVAFGFFMVVSSAAVLVFIFIEGVSK